MLLLRGPRVPFSAGRRVFVRTRLIQNWWRAKFVLSPRGKDLCGINQCSPYAIEQMQFIRVHVDRNARLLQIPQFEALYAGFDTGRTSTPALVRFWSLGLPRWQVLESCTLAPQRHKVVRRGAPRRDAVAAVAAAKSH